VDENAAAGSNSYSVCRITDRAILAIGYVWGVGGSHVAFTSTDGTTWTAAPDLDDIDPFFIVTDGKHAIVTYTKNSSTFLQAFDDGLKLAPLADSGDVPVQTNLNGYHPWSYAIGPTGIVVTQADNLWIGLPSAS
jgi:hypothetical protein